MRRTCCLPRRVHRSSLAKEIDMPEYLAPGVYVEETSFRSKSIEGVSTTTTGFVGSARFGPVTISSGADLLTSLGDFARIYGDGQPLQFEPDELPSDNQSW